MVGSVSSPLDEMKIQSSVCYWCANVKEHNKCVYVVVCVCVCVCSFCVCVCVYERESDIF